MDKAKKQLIVDLDDVRRSVYIQLKSGDIIGHTGSNDNKSNHIGIYFDRSTYAHNNNWYSLYYKNLEIRDKQLVNLLSVSTPKLYIRMFCRDDIHLTDWAINHIREFMAKVEQLLNPE